MWGSLCGEEPGAVRDILRDSRVRLGVVPADQLRGASWAAAVDKEAAGAGEFVFLLGEVADGEFVAGQVCAG